jgi:hypothetical protein
MNLSSTRFTLLDVSLLYYLVKRRNYEAPPREFFSAFCYSLFGRSMYCPYKGEGKAMGRLKVFYRCRQSSGFPLPAVIHLPVFTKEIRTLFLFPEFSAQILSPSLTAQFSNTLVRVLS